MTKRDGPRRAPTSKIAPGTVPGLDMLARKLQEGVRHLQGGRLREAEAACRAVLDVQPEQADALHILGHVARQKGNIQAAVELLQRAIKSDPRSPHLHNSLGVALKEAGSLEAAIGAYERALKLLPDYPEALTNLGTALRDAGRLEEALQRCRRAIELRPNYAEAHSNLGSVLMRLGQEDEAISAYEAAVRLQPQRGELYDNLGAALAIVRRWEEAEAAHRRATELAPRSAEALANLGVALHNLGRFEEACEAHRRAAALRPNDAMMPVNLSASLVELGKLDDALAACHAALAIAPDLPEAHNNLGHVLKATERIDEAIAAYGEALARRPAYADAFNNLGVAHTAIGRFDDGMAAYDRALELKPHHPESAWNRAQLLLLRGDYAAGWPAYESGWRAKLGRGRLRHIGIPRWQGTKLADRTLLVWSEQGVGDQLMFAGFIEELVALGARCVVEADRRLEPLLRRSIGGIEFISRETPPSPRLAEIPIDLQCPMGSLARWLRPDLVSFPRRQAYLRADPEQTLLIRERYRKSAGGRPVIGISWRGGALQSGRARSTRLTAWERILKRDDVAFVNLQYGDCTAELAEVHGALAIDVLNDGSIDSLKSLDDFASQTAAMDLIITVGNSTVHTAGALGMPAWVFLPFVPDWRWLLDRGDSPWYGSLRLFRQPQRGDWTSVFEAAGRALDEWMKTWRTRPHSS